MTTSGQLLPTVYAYRDAGVLGARTRWQPRKVSCTKESDHRDSESTTYVIKYRRGTAQSAAANVSELLTFLLLRRLRIRTLDAALAHVRPEFAASYARSADLGYTVDTGLHFCTVFDIDTESGPPPDYGFMHDPQELVEMWIADCWLMNRDREQDGNMRLALASSGRFSLIAADHSDCFLGAGRFADGSYVSLGRQHGAVPYPATATLVERAVCELGCLRALSLVGRIVAVAKELPQVIGCVPAEWWHQSGVSGMDVVTCLQERAGRMRSIIDIDRLEGIRRACNDGGQLL